MNVSLFDYGIIVPTETWLHSDKFDSEIIDDGYQVYRCDRDRVANERSDGGGELIAVRHALSAGSAGVVRRRLPLPIH